MFNLAARLLGRNLASTPVSTIKAQMSEPRPLPLGKQEFEEWSDRIISGALIPGVTAESQKWALANGLLHLGPTESHKPDAFFIHTLRKNCINQVAFAMMEEIKDAQKAREAEAKAAAEAAKAVANSDASLAANAH
jgi:hypothetical protein